VFLDVFHCSIPLASGLDEDGGDIGDDKGDEIDVKGIGDEV
jgi:hypothetical protein